MNPSRNGSSPSTSVTGWLAMALAGVLSTYIAARSWVQVRLHRDRHIEVTGSAKRRIVSDFINWRRRSRPKTWIARRPTSSFASTSSRR